MDHEEGLPAGSVPAGPVPRPIEAIRAYLAHYRIATHVPEDDCRGCHTARVIRELRSTCKGDIAVFRFFLNWIMEVS